MIRLMRRTVLILMLWPGVLLADAAVGWAELSTEEQAVLQPFEEDWEQLPPERQAQLPALVRRIARLAKVVVQIIELHVLVVADDREHRTKRGMQARLFPCTEGCVGLQKLVVRIDLDGQ